MQIQRGILVCVRAPRAVKGKVFTIYKKSLFSPVAYQPVSLCLSNMNQSSSVLRYMIRRTTSSPQAAHAGLSSTSFSMVQVTLVPLTVALAPLMEYAVAEL